MEIYDLDILRRDAKQEDLYDLFNKTYVQFAGIESEDYVVQPDEEMRIDLISFRLYQTTEYAYFLLNFNHIDNPLNIMQGDIIKYVDVSDIDAFKNALVLSEQIQQEILSASKATRKDMSRKEFVEQGYSLQPNFRETPQSPVQLIGSSLVISS